MIQFCKNLQRDTVKNYSYKGGYGLKKSMLFLQKKYNKLSPDAKKLLDVFADICIKNKHNKFVIINDETGEEELVTIDNDMIEFVKQKQNQ
jgi:hypothetical protein